ANAPHPTHAQLRSFDPPPRRGGGEPCEAWWRGRAKKLEALRTARNARPRLPPPARFARHLPRTAGEEPSFIRGIKCCVPRKRGTGSHGISPGMANRLLSARIR